MPLGNKLAIDSDEARRQRAELRTSYGNKISNMNLGRLASRPQAISIESTLKCRQKTPPSSSLLRRIASSFANVSDVNSGSRLALRHQDTEEDAREEHAEVLINSQPFKRGSAPGKELVGGPSSAATTVGSTAAAASPAATIKPAVAAAIESTRVRAGRTSIVEEPRNYHLCADVMRSRASERWGQIADIVSTLFRVRRNSMANPLSELRRLREQRDLLEAFTRPFSTRMTGIASELSNCQTPPPPPPQ